MRFAVTVRFHAANDMPSKTVADSLVNICQERVTEDKLAKCRHKQCTFYNSDMPNILVAT